MSRGARLRPLVSVAALLATSPALAFEGGQIRSGEHEDFSRLVMAVEPTTEWSLETRDRRATITFPEKSLDYNLRGVFDLIPRDRISDIQTATGPEGTTITLSLACDCRVSTKFVNGQYLAVDVKDASALAALSPDDPALIGPRPIASPVEPEAPGSAQAAGGVEGSLSAEDLLIRQIERAASQGLIQLADTAPRLTEPGTAPVRGAAETLSRDADAAPQAPAETAPAKPAQTSVPATGPSLPVQIEAGLPDVPETLAQLLDERQIAARTVYDRDGSSPISEPASPPVPTPCRQDPALAVGEWTNGLPLDRQIPQFNRALVGEFDRPNAEAVHDLARLYIRYGFGLEAENLLAQFDVQIAERALLVDLARAVEGRPVLSNEGLALDVICPGNHGLWLAVGGFQPVFRDADQFRALETSFSDLPPDLRALIGPDMVERLLDEGRNAQARVLLDIVERPGNYNADDLRLAAARVITAEGKPREGIQILSTLVEKNAPNAVDALTTMVRIAIGEDIAIPDRTVTDLRSAAFEHRRSAREPALRALLAETLAHRDELAAAMAEITAARKDLPPSIPLFDALAIEILAAADPALTGESVYAEAILTHGTLIGEGREIDTARRTIARRLLALGLVNTALDLLAPPIARGDADARKLAAEAHLRLGNGTVARLLLAGLAGDDVADLRARGFALGGDFDEAVVTLEAAGLSADATPYAWPSGDWSLARETSASSERIAMAGYMGARDGTLPGPEASDTPSELPPGEAFQQPLPPLDEASLGSARTLLANGRQVLDFVSDVLRTGN